MAPLSGGENVSDARKASVELVGRLNLFEK